MPLSHPHTPQGAVSPAQTLAAGSQHHSLVHAGAPPTSKDADLGTEDAVSEDGIWP